MLLRLSTLATGHTGIRPETAQLLAGAAHARDHAGGARVRLARLLRRPRAAVALRARADGRGRGARRRRGAAWPAARRPGRGRAGARRAGRQGGARADQRHRRHARHAGAGDPRPAARCCEAADVAAAMSVEAQLGTDRVFAPELQAIRPHPGQALSAANLTAILADSGVVASHRGPDCNRVQDAYSLRCSPQVHGAARDTVEHAADGRRARAGLGRRQPGGAGRGGPGRVQRQLPRRAGRLRAGLPRDRRRRRRLDQRAAYRPLPRQGPQPRAAAVPRRRPRRRQRPHDRAVHPGRDRLRAQAARRARRRSTRSRPARCRRTTSRWAGRPPASCAARSTG